MANEQSLGRALIRSILVWSGTLFVILAFAFSLGYRPLTSGLLAHDAQAWLQGYPGHAIRKRLAAGNLTGLAKDMPALLAARNVAGVVVFGADGKVLYSAFNRGASAGDAIPTRLDDRLTVFKGEIPGSPDRLWLVMDRQAAETIVLDAAAAAAGLMALLLAIILLGVRRALQRLDERHEPDSVSPAQPPQAEPRRPAQDEPVDAGHPQPIHSEHEAADKPLHQILECMPSCIWWADGSLHYQQVSRHASDLFGKAPRELTRQPLWGWLADANQSLANREKLDQAMKRGDDSLHLAYLARLPDRAHPRWLGEHISIRYDNDGHVRGLYGISSDITKRKQQEQTVQTHVERARRMETVGTLVGGIAHEFNNILAGIVGNIFLLRQAQGDTPKAQERLDRVDMLIRKASSMIEQLLAFARKSQVQPGKFSLKSHLEEILRILAPQLKSQARIVTDLHSDAGVLANRTQIQQALTHMVDNADRALLNTPEPTITVGLDEYEADATFLDHHPEIASPHLLHLTLTDNGEGIDPSDIDHIFEPFFTTREVGEGTGLGLSMVYGMVRHLGGAIMVDSQPGDGTAVHLYFPRAESISIEEDASGEVHYGHGEVVLLVEDEPIMRKVAAEVLLKLGYRVIEAIDGPDALREFEAHREEIRLVMVDLIMPVMGGTKVASMIRKTDPDMPVLFMTAHDLTDSIGPELSVPNSDLISKPFPIATLSTCLHRLLGGKEAQAEIDASHPPSEQLH